MASLNDKFETFLSNIEPPQARREAAQDMPTKVRDYLQKHEELKTVFPHSRLAGSYRRRTANGAIKDVDVLVFVSDEYAHDIEGLLKLLRRVLKDLPDELDDCGDLELRKQRRSIGIHLVKHDLFLDIVPVRLKTENAEDVLLVPDRGWNRWIDTQPLGYAAFLSTLNGKHEGKVVPLVKMFKHWRDEHFERRRPKSYWLETLIVAHLSRELISTQGKGYGEIVADLLESIFEDYKPFLEIPNAVPEVPDTMLRNNVAWNWERSHFETFMARIEESKDRARHAVNEAKAGNEPKAVELWQRIFGDDFPNSSVSEANAKVLQMSAALKKGAVTVSSTGLVSASAVVGIAAPPTRFYGEPERG